MSALLAAEGLGFVFPGAVSSAFEGVALSVGEGESVGLVGPNGSGKSTLLRVLASLLRPTAGVVLFRGRPLDQRLGEYRALLNYSQGAPFGFYPRLSAVDNLRFFSGLKGRLLGEPQTRALLSRVGLPADAWDKRYAQYSLGMKQRLHLARLLLEPCELLLLDEPTNGLDADGEETLVQALTGPLAGKAKVVISHDAAFLARVTSRRVSLAPAEAVA